MKVEDMQQLNLKISINHNLWKLKSSNYFLLDCIIQPGEITDL